MDTNSAGVKVISIPISALKGDANQNNAFYMEMSILVDKDSITKGMIKEYMENPYVGESRLNLYTRSGGLFMTGIYRADTKELKQISANGSQLTVSQRINAKSGAKLMSGGGDAGGITLEEVVIVGTPPPPPPVIIIVPTPSLPPTNPGIPVAPGGGSGGGGGGTPSTPATTVTINIEGKKVDPKEETKCFDTAKPAVLTIYVQQPNENTRDKMGANSVGHSFIGIQQGSIQRLFGFYPDSPNASLISSQNSEIHDNSNTLYHVSISVEIDATKLTNVVSYINNYPKTYDLNKYNCSDFGIGVAEKGGLNLPKITGSYNAVIVKFQGRNPGDLGQDIRNMSTPSGATKNTTKGNAPKKQGGC